MGEARVSQSPSRRRKLGHLLPNGDARVRSVYPSISDMLLRRRDVEMGQFRTHALQQSQGGFEIRCQACNSSSKALASFRSGVLNPSVNQP